jgi:hypothetical protein
MAGFEEILANGGLGSAALLQLLAALLGGPEATSRLSGQERLNSRVHRLRFETPGGPRSLVVKRLLPEVARRNAMVVNRWLPAVGLGHNGPVLLGAAAEASGEQVWHVYEDLGEWGLGAGAPAPERVEAAVRTIAELHLRFAGHALLGECRHWGGDLGIHFYTSSVQDALRALAALKPPAARSPDDFALLDRLIPRLENLLEEATRRAELLAVWGGPETLLHGDLWRTNVFVLPSRDGLAVRLIDWDHASVGPVSYDLSTFLYRFPGHERAWVFDAYRRVVSERGFFLPAPEIWNQLSETAELGRIANRLIWPALALLDGDGCWGWEELREVERWFQALEAVLPLAGESPK